MKLLIILVFVFYICGFYYVGGARSGTLYDGHDCPLGTPKHVLVDCNFCKCYMGNLVNCSRYTCNRDGIVESVDQMVCVEREMKFDQCTLCQCRNNTWYCMESQCKTSKVHTHRKRSILDSFCLFNGMKSTQGCKECVCSNGFWECSEEHCNVKHGETQYLSFFEEDLSETPCAPSDVLAIECSRCKCNENSLGYTCRTVDSCNADEPLEVKVRSAKIYINTIMEKD
ncbi:uncharacterized protein LOC135132195 [Zophobas morio]|uniref:uncharacterized protein LOC135132195 n=1 Tax=Zophobas morio TaxID=2755281 RepID=UPI003082CED8